MLVSSLNISQSFNYTPYLFYKKRFNSEINSFCIWTPETVSPPETDSMQHVKYIICLKDPARDLVGHFYHFCKLTSDLENRISFFDTLIEVSQFFNFFIKFIFFYFIIEIFWTGNECNIRPGKHESRSLNMCLHIRRKK